MNNPRLLLVLEVCKFGACKAKQLASLKRDNFQDQQQARAFHEFFDRKEIMWCPKLGKLAKFFNTSSYNCKPGSTIRLVCQAMQQADLQ